jgi:hypothetical protein
MRGISDAIVKRSFDEFYETTRAGWEQGDIAVR